MTARVNSDSGPIRPDNSGHLVKLPEESVGSTIHGHDFGTDTHFSILAVEFV